MTDTPTGPRATARPDILPGMSGLFAPAPDFVGDNKDDRAVPPHIFAPWHAEFQFTIDAAANHHNAKLPRYWTEKDNALAQSWAPERVYCNPPFSTLQPWIEKAWRETLCRLIVMLIPANRTEQPFWQEFIEPYRDKNGSSLRVRFLPTRIPFLSPGEDEIRPENSPPFGCCHLIWRRDL
jgi:phage N-6-adenine-methyltransferase